MTALPWTDARVEHLKALWLSGLSATQVAAALGGVTRNAVIGKLHRLGVAGRGTASPPGERPPMRAGARRRAAAPRPLRMAPPTVRQANATPVRPAVTPDAPDARPGVADLVLLGRHACRWPIGDPAADDFGFCGRPALEAGPYCADHHRRAYHGAGPRLESDRDLRRLFRGGA